MTQQRNSPRAPLRRAIAADGLAILTLLSLFALGAACGYAAAIVSGGTP